MLIDFHTHAFPDSVASMAMATLTRTGGMMPHTDGTLSALKAAMAADGVDLSVVLCIATNPHQQAHVNDFAIYANSQPGFMAFGSVHPDAPDALDELERLHAAGIKGIKFHPQYQGFYSDEERMRPIYRKISELGFITLFHGGVDYAYLPPYYNTPEHMANALKWLDTPVVAAHWGGLGCCEEVLKYLCGRELYFDLSFGYGVMPKPYAQAIVDKHGPDKLLFGSDMPWHRPSWEQSLVNALDISDTDREKIFSGNARKLLGI